MSRKILKFLNLWLPPILWAALIFKFSSGSIPVASQVFWQDFIIKKTGHVLLFGMFALLSYRGLTGEGLSRKKAAIWSVAIAFLYGASDEFHQMFTQGREATVRDVFIDGIGAGVVMYLFYNFLPRLPKKVRLFLLQFDIL
ncbi:MAG: VanZ family protein [Candidatus Microgenomates bacterium]|jgi:VanZ family protein